MHTQAPLGLDSLTSHSAFPSYIYTKRGNVKGGRRIFSEQRQPGVVYRAICTNKHDSTPQSWDARNGPHEQNGNGDSASETGYIVREARSEGEYQDAGWLRAVAYYEDQPIARYKESYTRQFAQTEARSLSKRTQPKLRLPTPETICLVATVPASESDEGGARVAGTLDIRPPASAGGVHPEGVPGSSHSSEEADSEGVYLLNVAVDPEWRGRGCGKVMLEAAEELIWKRWGAKRIYTHVSKTNEAAYSLYRSFGYDEHHIQEQGATTLLCKALE